MLHVALLERGDDRELLAPAAEVEGIDGRDAARIHDVAEDLKGSAADGLFDIGAARTIDAQHGRSLAGAEGIVVPILVLELLVVGQLDREFADALLDRDVGDVEGPVVVIDRAEHVRVLVEAVENLLRAIGQAHGPRLALQERDLVAGGTAAIDRERRIGGGAVENFPVGGIIPLVVRGEAAAGRSDVVDRQGAVSAHAVRHAALQLHTDRRGLERLVGEREIGGAEHVVRTLHVGLVAAVHEVHPDKEIVRHLAVHIELHAVGFVGAVAGEHLLHIARAGALRVDRGLTARLGIAKHQGVRTLVKIEALDVVGIRGDIPREEIPRAAAAGQAAVSNAVVVARLEPRRDVHARDELRCVFHVERPEVAHEFSGDDIDRDRELGQLLIGPAADQRRRRQPRFVVSVGDREGRKRNDLFGHARVGWLRALRASGHGDDNGRSQKNTKGTHSRCGLGIERGSARRSHTMEKHTRLSLPP